MEESKDTPLKQLTKDEIEKLDGKFDDDGFYILTEGGFYDPYGYFFDKEGKDARGGHYDEQGYYVGPQRLEEIKKYERQLGKDQIEKLEGCYDKDGFFILKEGGFYDPEGFYFDRDGYDAIGGYYNKEGVYVAPPNEDDLSDSEALDEDQDQEEEDADSEFFDENDKISIGV